MELVAIKGTHISLPSRLSDLLEPVKYVEVSGGFVAGIDKISVLGDRLILMDRVGSQILGIDQAGNRLFTYNSVGEGPGEFRHLIDIAVDNRGHRIFILDHHKNLCLSGHGDFIGEVPLSEGGMAFVYDELEDVFQILLGRGHPMLLGIVSSDGVLKGEFVAKDNLNRMLNRETLFQDGDGVFLHLYLNDTIYKLGSKGPVPHTYLDFERKISKDQYVDLDNYFSVDRILDVLPEIMSNVNFYRQVRDGVFVVFHYQGDMHWLITTRSHGQPDLVSCFNLGQTSDDLTFEERLNIPMAVDGEGNLVFVLNPEGLTPTLLDGWNPGHPEGVSFMQTLKERDRLPENPIILFAKIL